MKNRDIFQSISTRAAERDRLTWEALEGVDRGESISDAELDAEIAKWVRAAAKPATKVAGKPAPRK
jgi:hypothetical protein